ncbi:unnamed protein product [Spodoptera exigua]|nr:unnamed protein product [Spodoptera exigua]
MSNVEDERIYGSRRMSITLLLSQTLGVYTMLFLPHAAVASGAAGYVIVYSLIYVVIGIPVMYMENVLGQFTGRDCIEVWKVRPCLSHFGYVHVVWHLDSEWGPTSEILRRSRAMFTAQAMTKEYMYRHYHLKAGILKRQQRSNVRIKPARTEGVRFDIYRK